MGKIQPKLISKLDASTVKFQNVVINRLKLFDFSKSAILYYSKSLKKDFHGYSFDKFQGQFKLVGFKKGAKVKSVGYKEIVNVGNSYIKGELSGSIFILNMATFEHWLLWSIKELILSNPKEYFPKSRKQIEITHLKKFTDMQKLWEELTDDYLGGLPYQGMKEMLKIFISRFGLNEVDFTKDIINKLNENSQCRNMIIHNQKKVNETYIRKCVK